MATSDSNSRRGRPREPTPAEHIIFLRGGRPPAAIEMLPSRMGKLKERPWGDVTMQELWQCIGDLRLENGWLKECIQRLLAFRQDDIEAHQRKGAQLQRLEEDLAAADRNFLESWGITPVEGR